MRKIDTIIIHCAATPNGKHFTVEDIDRWHRERGFQRSAAARQKFNPALASIGYHAVIYLDGSVHYGRHVDEVGAHAVGRNATSIGVCMIGTDAFTESQWVALHDLTAALAATYPEARFIGHRDVPGVAKACPGFDVAGWQGGKMVSMAGHIQEVA